MDEKDRGKGGKDAATPPTANKNPSDTLFDPSRLRLSQDFTATAGVKKLLSTVPVRKPDRQWFVRVHPDEAYHLPVALIEAKDDRETYLVEPALHAELVDVVVPKMLFTAITRQNVLFLWPVRLPGADGRHDPWNASALEAAHLAMNSWVRIAANMALGAYEIFEAQGTLPEPEWPDVPFGTLLETAFRDHFIRTTDHPVVRRLRGEI